VKCPKCAYLGFETGERCKNCGYDFSLLASNAFDPPVPEPDITIRAEESSDESMDMWLRDLDRALPARNVERFTDIDSSSEAEEAESLPASRPPQSESYEDSVDISLDPFTDAPDVVNDPPAPLPHLRSVNSALPLFIPRDEDDDTPLITLPAAPRPPLAVRRTPDVPRLRAVSRFRAVEPALDFREEAESDAASITTDHRDERSDVDVNRARRSVSAAEDAVTGIVGGRRLAAAVIDNLILLSIDLVVVYLTLRMAGLQTSEWRMIPRLPIGIFLGMMAFAYFAAFTAVGGQTIGKMSTGIRVVGEDRRAVDGVAAVRRTLAALLSYITVGLAYLPGFFGDRRTVHDRVSRTRVVAPPSA
jgi:uncharacterized RDD family membrane protein YckC